MEFQTPLPTQNDDEPAMAPTVELQTPSLTQDNDEPAMARNPLYYRPTVPSSTEIGDVTTIQQGVVGDDDRPLDKWAKMMWETLWKTAAKVVFLKGKLLPKLLKKQPVRELMAPPGFFFSGKREEERISDGISNIESAVIQCLGVVQDHQCTNCLKFEGP
ncbi:hypothetical protein CBS147332_531 [Penicillium roqueforti]|nr:hypothetical protein CBS147332_531 [Penicillium roqueforti]KAI3120670.1 hypothetical protein CBS147331_1889 [Penicillium roqueforti]